MGSKSMTMKTEEDTSTPSSSKLQHEKEQFSTSDSEGDDEDSFGEASSSSLSGASSQKRRQQKVDAQYRAGLAQQETKAIRRLKIILVLLMIGVAGSIAAVVYKYTSDIQQDEFEAEFFEQGTKLVSGFYADSFQKLQALESLSSALTYYALTLNEDGTTSSSWPFVHIEKSHEFFHPFLSLANAASIKLLPIVHSRQRLDWEDHVRNHQDWVEQDLLKQIQPNNDAGDDDNNNSTRRFLQYFNDIENNRISPFIKNYVGVDTSPKLWMPWWQYAPVIANNWFLNFNQLADSEFQEDAPTLLEKGHAVIAKAEAYLPGLDFQSTRDLTFTQELLAAGGYGQYQPGEPIGFIHYPVFEQPRNEKDMDEENPIVAVVSATVYWKTYFQDILPESVNGIICVVENDLQTFTYKIDGTTATFMGMEDLHDDAYNDLEISAEYNGFQDDDQRANLGKLYTGVPVDESRLAYKIRVYPSKALQEPFETNDPWWYATVVAAVMLLAVLVFIVYDCYVERRQQKVSNVAVKSNAIVSSLFPESVKDKLLGNSGRDDTENSGSHNRINAAFYKHKKSNPLKPPGSPQKGLASSRHGSHSGSMRHSDRSPKRADMNYQDYDDEDLHPMDASDPIADFFPSATVLFMDIAGFTAWSSSREPSQVFVLLETIYRSFDRIANRRRVFKVETIGDCYVAVCGLPQPCQNHARVMAHFARDCMEKMNHLAHRLEPKLGPDTGDLTVRVGLHSGPVTAGVLRGERARFQLFGDTVNTASRMESTGKPGFIQVSQECAELISAGGKSQWLRQRSDTVQAKGKGELQTFWLLPKSTRTISTASPYHSVDGSESNGQYGEDDAIDYMQNNSSHHNNPLLSPSESGGADEITTMRLQRLVDFNYEILLSILKEIMARHDAQKDSNGTKKTTRVRIPLHKKGSGHSLGNNDDTTTAATNASDSCCLDEVAEIIALPVFDQAAIENNAGTESMEVPLEVKTQLRTFVEAIARMYRDRNAFHNFDHACHVTQSSSKLLSRIVAVKKIGNMEEAHDQTFGITSDPLTQFAVIFSAMIHDVDHRGVPNNILAKEEPDMAKLYKHHAIAEQNSVEIAWELLMEPTFSELRNAIYHGQEEMNRFRQLVVNCLMATDIFDPQLKAMREQRWQNAFHHPANNTSTTGDGSTLEDEVTVNNRKATIVIEHIIQASDVSHTMQHWHVYNKWNEKLFCEMYMAYKEGRTNNDPSKGWYMGELWFFDNYVIPLAEKLEECGVFGVSSDEYLIYARANRQEWEKKGKGIVKENLKRIQHRLEQQAKQLPQQLPLLSDTDNETNNNNDNNTTVVQDDIMDIDDNVILQ